MRPRSGIDAGDSEFAQAADPRVAFREQARFLLDAARLELLASRRPLEAAQTADPPKQRILVLQYQFEVIESELILLDRQLQYAEAFGVDNPRLTADRETVQKLTDDFEKLRITLDVATSERDPNLRDLFCTVSTDDERLQATFEGSPVWLQTGDREATVLERTLNELGDVPFSRLLPGRYALRLLLDKDEYVVTDIVLP